MSHVPPPPLTPEERTLADALARMDAPAAPSARLDAAIRAAARDAIAPTVRGGHGRRRPRRWATGMGIAASVVLAVGVAWQLRPLPSDGVAYDEAPLRAVIPSSSPEDATGAARARSAAPADAAAGASSPGVEATPDAMEDAPEAASRSPSSAPAAPPPASVPAPAPRAAAPPAPVPPQVSPAAPPVPREQPVVFDTPSPMDAPAPAPPPVPAPAADRASSEAQRASAPPPAPPAPPAPPPAAPTSAAQSITVTGSRIAPSATGEARAERAPPVDTALDRDPWHDDQPLDDQPPATFDAPDVREAWLARIRELRDAGQLAPARASLAEFRRRYPELALPDDLRPLLE